MLARVYTSARTLATQTDQPSEGAQPCASMERAPWDAFICPITMDVMVSPVCGPDGRSYERAAIERALLGNPHTPAGISPITRQPMMADQLWANLSLRSAIETWLNEQPLAIDPPERLELTIPEEVIGEGSFGQVSAWAHTSLDRMVHLACLLC
jgi:hypothetical protein